MSAPMRTGTRTTDTMDLPVRAGSNVSGEESSGSSGKLPCARCVSSHMMLTAAPTDDRVKFQKTTNGERQLRKTSASNNAALRGRSKVPLGPRERPQDFSKPRSVAWGWLLGKRC